MSVGQDTKYLHFIGAVYLDGFLWTNALEWNGYYKVDIKTGKAVFLGLFDYADILADKLFYQVLNYDKFVFFIPWFSNYLVRLDTITLETKYWKLPEIIEVEIAKFRAAHIYGKKIFMFPHVGNSICVFDIEKELFECDEKVVKEISQFEKGNIKDRFLQGCQKEEVVYLPHFSSSLVLKYNLIDYKCEVILFPKEEKNIVYIAEVDNKLIILTGIGNIWEYCMDNHCRRLIYQYDGEKYYPYRCVVPVKDSLYLMPAREKHMKVLKNGGEDIIPYPFGWELKYINVDIESVFDGHFIDESRILFYPCQGNMLLSLGVEQALLQGVEVCENPENREKAMVGHTVLFDIKGNILKESRVDLGLFLNVFTEKRYKSNHINNLEMYGKQIWNTTKRG